MDIERWPDWTPSTTSTVRIDSRELGPGSKVRTKQPKLAPMIWTVTEFEPGRSFAWTARSVGLTSVAKHQLTPKGATTAVTLRVEQEGALAGLVWALYGGLTRRYVKTEAQGLKQRCERMAARAPHP